MMCAYLLRDEHSRPHGASTWPPSECVSCILSIYRYNPSTGSSTIRPHAHRAFSHHRPQRRHRHHDSKGFFPQQDTGTLGGGVQGPQDSSFPAMNDSVQKIVDVIKKDPAVQNVMAFTEAAVPTNTGKIFSSR